MGGHAMIVVGVDGSRPALEAVAWAAREAVLRGRKLLVAHAMPAWARDATDKDRYAGVARWMREGAEVVLTAGVDRARREAPSVVVEQALLGGDSRAALLKLAPEAELLVVGSHGLGGFRGLLVGSVAQGVAGHAACDVVVVRALPRGSRGEIVAGVDGSPAGEPVLAFAFAEADLRKARLRVVHAWRWHEATSVLHASSGEEDERRLLGEVLAGWRERYPDVEVVTEVVNGHPVEVLRDAAGEADLLVIGSRGHGGVTGLIMGSVSQAMLHHARCPLAVIRSSSGDGRPR
ncbi:universal stress protein [Thermoactinospora rubra]|uniref:universal stress protein n=1 Tax=Thermoactinospora rubra TaxID=1088767 RepID=UPI001F0A2F91|nr:universal stress protein [Thermoactinospora rubra]